MEINFILIGIAALAILLWIFSGIKDKQRKFFVLLIILFLLFAVYGFNATFSGRDVQISSVGDLGNAANLYLSWFGNAFNNIKILTANAVKLDWKGNQTT